MSDETTGTQAQVAAPDASQGQVPGESTPSLTLEQALDALKKARDEAAKHRTKLSAFEQAAKEAEQAKLTELERQTKRVQELEGQHKAATERVIRSEVALAATKHGIVDPSDAAKLLDWDRVEYDDAGSPTNVDALLKELVKSKPYLAGTTVPRIAATNGAANRGNEPGSRVYTQSEIADYGFYQKHREDIQLAMKQGRVLPG